jgi:cytidylate kinase
MIKVLTIEREYGSGAAEIAQKLADRLGWKLWDQFLTNEIARRLECQSHDIEQHQERRDPLYYRMFKSFLRGSFEGSQNAALMKVADAESIRRVAEKLVRKAAEEGQAVIVGRGAAYYLHDNPECYHVFIFAPFEDRVRRLQQAGKTEAEAVQLAETVDRDKKEFIHDHFGVDWPSRHFFHLMVNSSMGDEPVVQTILDGLAAVNKT